MKHIADRVKLNNGVEMPWLGLGVWKVEDGEVVASAVKNAIDLGYRSIDTAAVYKNEAGVGQGIADSGIPREELFVTTKVWNSEQGYESTLQAFEESRNKLGLDYIDLYLVHWPVKGKYIDTWRALEKLYSDGRVRAIGVSNFHIHHLQDILESGSVVPVVNQVEYHPMLAQRELHTFCKSHQIVLEAWSPLMQGKLLDDPTLNDIAAKYGKSASQVILRWDLQHGVITIPKSINRERIAQNGEIFDFELSAEDMQRIDAMNKEQRVGPDPDHIDF